MPKSYSPSLAGPSRPTPELPAIYIQKHSLACNNALSGSSKVHKPHTPLPPYRPPPEFLKSRCRTSETIMVAGPSYTKWPCEEEDILEEWSKASGESLVGRYLSPESAAGTNSNKWSMVRGKKRLPSTISFKKL